MKPGDRQNSTSAASLLDRLPLKRVVLWSHFAFAFLSLFVFLNYVDLSHFAWWSRRASIVLIFEGTPVLLPYAISAGYCQQLYTWQVTGPTRMRVASFIGVLALGAVLVDSALLGAFGDIERFAILQLLVAQTWGYLWGANWILDVI